MRIIDADRYRKDLLSAYDDVSMELEVLDRQPLISAIPIPEGATNGEMVEEMEKHTDRQIYDGCILLMQKMVDYFQEYLEYLGYDLDLLDEDERFVIEMSNMEIVRQLFLQNTGNSGGYSTRDFCEKLGVSPYKGVKFEFERGAEE